MKTPKYVARIARLPEVLETLAAHPNGLPLAVLAAEVGVDADELREDLLTFYAADLSPFLFGLSRPDVLEFFGADGDDDIDPNDAVIVRISDPRPFDELGVEYVDASELALIYTSACALLELEPEDQDLADAVDVLAESMLGAQADTVPSARRTGGALTAIRQAQRDRRLARIVYSRTWEVGVFEKVIEPYRLVQTRRGWEVDAGPLDGSAKLRTYLLSNVRSCEVLEEVFESPSNLEERLRGQRTTETVRVRLPHHARWAADMYAEQVEVVSDDEQAVILDLALLPPLTRRVGLLMLVAGTEAAVVAPPELADAGAELAQELLQHHR